MRTDLDRLQDIQEAISKIEKYAVLGRARFESDELIQTWIIYQFQIIGEAARSLSTELKNRYSDLPWPQIELLLRVSSKS